MKPFLLEHVVVNAGPPPEVASLQSSPRWPLVGRSRPGRAGVPGRGIGLLQRAAGLVVGLIMLSVAPAYALDANKASVAQLETLDGVGPRTAQIIVQERERGGPFESLEDLSDRVRGIGKKRLTRLRDAGLSVGGGATVFSPSTVASPHFAPALPAVTPLGP